MRVLGLLVSIGLVGACGDNNAAGTGNTLVRVDDEPAGVNCENGGVAIHTGIDSNGNGQVDDNEITSTSYVCNGPSGLKCPNGSTVLEGVVTVFSSTELSKLDGVSCIDGDLIIAGISDLALPQLPLEVVTGGVTIAGNPSLVSLDGFGALHEVGRTYAIQGNSSLADISSVGSLDKLGSVFIVGNDSLVNLDGLQTWSTIEHGITVSNNNALASLTGLENLLTSTQNLTIKSNRSLTSLAALDGLRSVAILEISGNPKLATIAPAALQKIDVRLVLNSNPALTTLSLPSLATTSGIQINSNAALTSISFPSLVTTWLFSIQVNTALTTISAPNLAATTGDIDLTILPALSTVNFSSLATTGGSLLLSSASALANLSGFPKLASVAGNFVVNGCNALDDFAGVENLTSVSGNMVLSNNAQLSNFTGMAGSFASVGGDLAIIANPQLPTATAQSFASSISVGGTVTIQ